MIFPLHQNASWLTGATRDANICRHEFKLNESQVKRAILLVAGLGYFKATLVSHCICIPSYDCVEHDLALSCPLYVYTCDNTEWPKRH